MALEQGPICHFADGLTAAPRPWCLSSMLPRAAVLLLALAGCGARTALADPADASPADGAAAPSSPCARLADTVCARLARCAPAALSNGLTGGRAVGSARCPERVTLACEGWRSIADLAATPAQVEACGAELAAASCGEVGWRYFGDGPPCASWPRGRRAIGAPCRLGAQCASGECAYRVDRGCGVCASAAAPPTQRAGDPCDARRRCQYWLRCEGGACVESSGEGGACAGDGQCDRAQGLGCERASGRCARRPVAPEGGACLSQSPAGDGERPSAMCPVDTTCFNRNDFGQGRCEALLADGAPCLSYDSACAYPARCQGGRCVLPAQVACAP